VSDGGLNRITKGIDDSCICKRCHKLQPIHQFYTKGKGRRDAVCKSCVLKTKAAHRAKAKKIKKQSKDTLKRNRGAVLNIADLVLVETVESIDSPHLHKIVEEYVDRIAREELGGFE
jgi:hypothetical protein